MVVVPPNTNRGPSFTGRPVRLDGRKPGWLPVCRAEVLAAFAALSARSGRQLFTVREVYAEMRECGTSYAEATVSKTMQRMEELPTRLPYVRLERVGRRGFRLETTTG